MQFSWDQSKNRVNQQKHGVSFELAQIALDDPHSVSRQDRFENGEARWQTIGKLGDTMLILLVSHTVNEVDDYEEHIRIISHAEPLALKGKSMNKVPKALRAEVAKLLAKPESEISFADVPETQTTDWAGAQRGRLYRPIKKQLTVRIDADVIEWLKADGVGYQSRLNQILRDAMHGQDEAA